MAIQGHREQEPAPVVTDNCAGAIVSSSHSPGTIFAVGITAVTYTATDAHSNTSFCSFTITVSDVSAPVADIPNIDIQDDCSITLTPPTATDNCVGIITATTTDLLTYNVPGVYTVIWSYDDGAGNISTQPQIVTVEDNDAPAPDVVSLTDITGNCTVNVSTSPTSTDNCSGTITGTTTDPLFYNIPGTYTITWSYNDGNGNTSTQTQTVIVDDCMGVDQADHDMSINLYPNPGNGLFTLSISQLPRGGAQIRLMDELGQILYVNTIQNLVQTYDFTYLRPATYYVQIIGDEVNIVKPLIVTGRN